MASFTKSTHTQTQQGREVLFLEGSCGGMDFFTFAFENPCKAMGLKLDIILIVLFTFLKMC